MYAPLASKVQTLCTIVPEGHAYTRDGVKDLEAANGLLGVARVPETKLTVAHARETSSRDAVGLTHPYGAAVLGTGVARNFLGRLLLSHIPYAQLLVTARGDEEGSIGAP
jgi:hypothetical protein